MSHKVETCQTPPMSRRWKRSVWVCPACARQWTLQQTDCAPPRETGGYATQFRGGPFWTWWPLDAFRDEMMLRGKKS